MRAVRAAALPPRPSAHRRSKHAPLPAPAAACALDAVPVCPAVFAHRQRYAVAAAALAVHHPSGGPLMRAFAAGIELISAQRALRAETLGHRQRAIAVDTRPVAHAL